MPPAATMIEPGSETASEKWENEFRERDYKLAELIQRIANGDQSAIAKFYQMTNRLIFGLVLRILGNRDSAEEVLFDVYTQVWRQAARYEAKRGGPTSWLITIARSRAIDRLRADKHYVLHDELTEAAANEYLTTENPETATAISELQGFVRSALETLSPDQREVIEMAYYAGMTQSEIALQLGIAIGTVKTRTRLAMAKLRDALQPLMV
ncbi:MAG: sigma-70 family RNA polymerase sigma factor [Acidobacteriota bacterium]